MAMKLRLAKRSVFLPALRAGVYNSRAGANVTDTARLPQDHGRRRRVARAAAECSALPRRRCAAPAADPLALELANEALNAARGAGASYADVRIGRYRRQIVVDARAPGHRRQRQRVVRPRRPHAGQRLLGLRRHERR